MQEYVLHHHEDAPDGLSLPFSWQRAPDGATPQIGHLSFAAGKLATFDGERWQHIDLAQVLNSLRPSPKGFVAEPLARALDLIKRRPLRVIDASCGSGKDAIQVWRWGFEVVAFERHPLVYALLWDALRRHPLPKFTLHFGSASEQRFNPSDHIMYDPMFLETTKKKSLSRKEIALFKTIVGSDQDQLEVLNKLLHSGASRVVIKRPLKLASEPKPNHSFAGKTTRLDVYLAAIS